MSGRARQNPDATVDSISTVFVIVYLQETAWIIAPLIISLNMMVHSYLSMSDDPTLKDSQLLSLIACLFFVITGLLTVIGLMLAHYCALAKLKKKYLLPYLFTKSTRIIVLLGVAVYIMVHDELRNRYFYVSLYGIFESLAGFVALEIVFRSWRYLKKAKKRRRQENYDLIRSRNSLKTGSIRSCQSDP